ncbi:MAG: hypothetical protein LKG20_01815 [Tetrasphaera jenkinsii]|jgi:hypothetical protein|uniref:Uncharacterized protein n=1 Tax=Nostocoides jenkinsii Ben 74 TaxID=1193518 RepID=A0A077MB28_9MICO|nr:hypothetical protein [Tetrasphaera jenkinsii]MCI1261012.1 hypothetical protein [Tetrasphaera jenkinsii]CCI54561.1 hypothetical protein BN13_760011 [Tetrasphaera jenkinsii Ben 74]
MASVDFPDGAGVLPAHLYVRDEVQDAPGPPATRRERLARHRVTVAVRETIAEARATTSHGRAIKPFWRRPATWVAAATIGAVGFGAGALATGGEHHELGHHMSMMMDGNGR